MKNSPLTAILLSLLAISAVASAGFCFYYASAARQIRQIQPQVAAINNHNAAISALAADLLEYSKTHPDINPLLESAGVKARTGAAAVPPSTKLAR
jgi:hypothetical protein